MFRKTTLTLVTLLLVSVFLNVPVWAASGGGVEDNQVFADSYFRIPGSNEWASFDTGIPDHPYEYRFELKCFDASAGDLECLYENRSACTAGERGRLVYWFYSLKGSGDWNPFGEAPMCIYAEKPKDTGDRIRENIFAEFQSRAIAPAVMGMQPSPHTLIGAHTNFYADAKIQTFDFMMFDQNIRIVAEPTEYDWVYGDGATYGPARFAGGPLPPDRWGEATPTSHVYLTPGDYLASVTVYFSAEYSVNGGPMVPIEGRATVPSAPLTIRVWKSESRNVAYDCLENPAGFGC